jgi:hypothetical protein
MGRGAVTALSRATGVARATITRGVEEFAASLPMRGHQFHAEWNYTFQTEWQPPPAPDTPETSKGKYCADPQQWIVLLSVPEQKGPPRWRSI